MNATILTWVIPALAMLATVAGTYFVSRHGASSDFLDRLIKENEHYATDARKWLHERTDLMTKMTDLHSRDAENKDEIFQLRMENIDLRRKIDDLKDELGR